ncbi:putative aspartyl aminopeptidase [Phaeomoniella chlamydospora]|uniref:aspartyl aminopeptidase n=1 Tax=Phaeomoniella chlamydospora TaxID=158046 RepID=A0A0G2DUE8_PHACM|nr:putative aspartyl aminopeptidase [Phaeomoniella chlamydospora]
MSRIIQTAAAEGFLEYVNASPTPFHAEKEPWSSTCKPGGKYVLTRNGSTIVAFAVGKKWRPGNPVSMIGAHTDSPTLRLKPVSKKEGSGFLQVGVETYGGGLWHTWFDRDLGLAGRVMVKDGKGSIIQKLVHINKPILRIPTLAIHFERQEKFEFNKQDQLFPIAGLIAAELKRQDEIKATNGNKETTTPTSTEDFAPLKAVTQRHHSHIVELIAKDADASPDDVVDFEVILFDTQKSCLGGLQDEFIFSARLDNLNSTYCATIGMIESVSDPAALEEDSTIRLIACFDNEEIGSTTTQGADSHMLPAIIRRLSVLPSSHFEDGESEKSYDKTVEADVSTAFEQTLASSFLVSADMAHSVNPNYAGKYEPDHRPEMNKGPVIKINANARYTTNSPGIALIQEVAKKAAPLTKDDERGVPLQLFVIRNDSLCGSTIGPMISAKLGVRALDLGNPQLSMHSIRETGGTEDVGYAIRLFKSFFQHYGALEKTIFVD